MSLIIELLEQGEYEKAEPAISRSMEDNACSDKALLQQAVCAALQAPASAEGLSTLWLEAQSVMKDIEAMPAPERFIEAAKLVRLLALPRAALFRKCNDRQKLEYAYLEKDVCFEKKEYVIAEFQRILLEAEQEYSVVLRLYYGLSEFLVGLTPLDEAGPDFLRLCMKELSTAYEVQECTGRLEEFPHIRLARAACALPGDCPEDVAEQRKQLLSKTLYGKEALEAWDEFKAYAEPSLYKKLVKQARKKDFLDKLQFWK